MDGDIINGKPRVLVEGADQRLVGTVVTALGEGGLLSYSISICLSYLAVLVEPLTRCGVSACFWTITSSSPVRKPRKPLL